MSNVSIPSWHKTPFAQAVLATEKQHVAQCCQRQAVDHALWLSQWPHDSLPKSMIGKTIRCDVASATQGDCVTDLAALPFVHDHFDLVCLQHVLEYAECSHALLSEAHRVLKPGGLLCVLTFNPLSLMNVTHSWFHRKQMPWSGQFYTLFSLKRQLRSLSGSLVSAKTAFYRPYCQSSCLRRLTCLEWMGELLWPAFGAVNIVVFRKEVIPLSALRLGNRVQRLNLDKRLIEPTSRTRT